MNAPLEPGWASLKLQAIPVEDVILAVCVAFRMPMEELLGKTREKHIVEKRHLAICVARRVCGMSFPSLARAFLLKDHSTALYAVRKVERQLETNPRLRAVFDELTKQFKVAS